MSGILNRVDYQDVNGLTGFVYSRTEVDDIIAQRVAFAGTYTLPTFTPSGGNMIVGTGEYMFATGTDGAAPFVRYTLNGGTFALTQNAVNFIIADYNGGAPLIRVSTTNSDVDNLKIYPIALVTYDGTNVGYVDLAQGARGLPNKIALMLARTQRIVIEPGGLVLGESGTRNVTLTTGRAWYVGTSSALSSFTSATHEMEFYYHVSGVWTSTTVTQYNNSQYDDGTGLQTLSGSRYAVNWIYRTLAQNQTKCFMVLGSGNYTLAQAQVSAIPSGLPSEIVASSVLVGRIIVQNGDSVAQRIDSAFATTFTSAGVTDHGGLSNLQGGTTAEYYHLTSAQHATLTAIASVSYAELTAANAALPSGRIFFNQALGYLDTTTA